MGSNPTLTITTFDREWSIHSDREGLTVAASWEVRKHHNTLVAILHTETVSFNWALGLRRMHIPGPQPIGVVGMPYDHARNEACKALLSSNLEWLFFLDSDVITPSDIILRLQRHGRPIISGVYARRSVPESIPVMLRDRQWLHTIPAKGLIDVHLVGAGCLLIHRSILQAFLDRQVGRPGKPWFDWRVDMAGIMPPEECLSEDFSFCHLARTRLKVPIIVDCELVCKHVGLSEALPGSFRPLGATPDVA